MRKLRMKQDQKSKQLADRQLRDSTALVSVSGCAAALLLLFLPGLALGQHNPLRNYNYSGSLSYHEERYVQTKVNYRLWEERRAQYIQRLRQQESRERQAEYSRLNRLESDRMRRISQELQAQRAHRERRLAQLRKEREQLRASAEGQEGKSSTFRRKAEAKPEEIKDEKVELFNGNGATGDHSEDEKEATDERPTRRSSFWTHLKRALFH